MTLPLPAVVSEGMQLRLDSSAASKLLTRTAASSVASMKPFDERASELHRRRAPLCFGVYAMPLSSPAKLDGLPRQQVERNLPACLSAAYAQLSLQAASMRL